MKRAYLCAAFLMSLFPTPMHAQSPAPMDFFPHHKGDIWEYYAPDFPSKREWNRILKDSLAPDGNYYLETTLFGMMKVDTVKGEVWDNSWGGPLYGNLRYQLSADSGQTWTVAMLDSQDSLVARVRVVRRLILYGAARDVKMVDVFGRFSSGGSVLYTTDHLAWGLGMVEQDNDMFPARVLAGAIIDGRQYGVISKVPEMSSELLPRAVVLEQNYPNPFNGVSVLSFTLPRSMHVRLLVSNTLGQTICSPVDGILPAGHHSTRIDVGRLASGMYFAVLETSSGRLVRRMLLVK